MRRLALPLLSLLLLPACDGTPAAPGPSDTPALNAAASRDLLLARPARATWLDNQRDLGDPPDVLLLGYDPADHPACHVGDPTPRGITVQEVFHVTHEATDYPGEHDLVTIPGKAPIYMYDRAAFLATAGDDAARCAFVTSQWFASGQWTALLYEDNDFSGWDGTPGTNSYGISESGILVGNDGTRYRYEWKYRAQCIPGECSLIHGTDHVVRVP